MPSAGKTFNIAGPCHPNDHYMIDPLTRLSDVRELINGKHYFIVHAPRQTGKTTLLLALAAQITSEGRYAALHFSCEVGQAFGGDFRGVEDALLAEIVRCAEQQLPEELRPPAHWGNGTEGTKIVHGLSVWSKSCARPLVLFFDEVDALVDASLQSVLRQLRAGFPSRPTHFPHCIVLCGLRDIRDYKVASGGSPTLGTASPFNIKSDSIRLANFTKEDIASLYGQHTKATGQIFTEDAVEKAWELTEGQPWLVNSLAREIIFTMKIPSSQNIYGDLMAEAGQRLILARQTHLDSLVSKLYEYRVKSVMEPILAGTLGVADMTYNDSISYVRDLGLVSPKPPLRIANAIYQEVIVRVLSEQVSDAIVLERPSFVDAQGSLDVHSILTDFVAWWSEHAEVLLQGQSYSEVAAQLVFMAWLQRVVNGGGVIDREYGIGRGRIDVLIRWPLPESRTPRDWQREAFELKVWAAGRPDPQSQGLLQLERYLDGLNLTQGTLVIFDRRPDAKPAAERTSLATAQTPKGYAVRLLRA